MDAASGALMVVAFLLATPLLLSAQVHGVPPSVTSIQFHVPPFLPNAMPSVTSLGPYGAGYRAGPIPPPYGIHPNHSGYGHGHRNGYGYNGYGGVYAVPYYVPIYDSSYGYDSGGGGPYVESGPPPEQTLHIVVDTAPPRRDVVPHDEDTDAAALNLPPAPGYEHDARAVESIVLIFRDGHQQEVTNYAIMGQTVYVFDQRTQKIAVGDLDLPATVKANDDRGVEFQLPGPKPS